MNTLLIEHVRVAELPEAWRSKLGSVVEDLDSARVTVRIEEEAQTSEAPAYFVTDDPAFGIWRDRHDMADVATYVRKLRAPRHRFDGSRN